MGSREKEGGCERIEDDGWTNKRDVRKALKERHTAIKTFAASTSSATKRER
jgi:hypothetical protein